MLLFLPVLSGILLCLSFPDYDSAWLAWIALVPLLVALLHTSPLYGFLLSGLFGIVFFAMVFGWNFAIPRYNIWHHITFEFYFGPLMGLLGLCVCSVAKRRSPIMALWAFPFFWVSLEYLRSNFSFLALPWALLGHSQFKNLLIIQPAAITGAYGISFLLAFVNAAIAAGVLYSLTLISITLRPSLHLVSKRSVLSIITTAVGLTLVFIGYGRLNISVPEENRSIRISVLQGNINQDKKSNPSKYAEQIMQTYIDLTRAAADQEPELIIWPEAATPGFILKNMAHMNQIVPLIRETDAYFLIGSSEYPKFQKGLEFDKEKYGNTALFFSPKGKVLDQYLKIHLVPFGETIPYEETIPWPSFIVSKEKRSFEIPGEEFTLFNIEDEKFGVLICWEVVFPNLFRTFVERGAGFMLNITNEGWFGDTAAPHQMLAINVFRAIENRVVLARAANTGISCFIDPTGRITAGSRMKKAKRHLSKGT